MAVLAVVLEALACLGLGALALSALRVDRELDLAEGLAFAFALGLGLLGWFLFPLGLAGALRPEWILSLLLPAAAGVVLLPRRLPAGRERVGVVGALLLAGLAAALAFDLVEALSPPTDADSLAYHFALPKQFLAAGRIEFVPRAIDGAVPLLVQMTYVPALALGGETALTLWTMLSGWAAAGLLYVIARRHLSLPWALALALLLLTTPAVVYGAGSGQVETRIALFALAAAWAAGRALESEDPRYAALAGLAAGFAVGAKYTGLIFAVAAGTVLLVQRRWLAHGVAFSAAALAFGWQWYWWNWVNAGDPLFPMLFDWLGVRDPSFWNADQHAFFKEAWPRVELPLARAPWNLFAYPVLATFAPWAAFESGRTGLGPYAVLVLPFALLGAFRFRDRIRRDALFAFAAIAVLFYLLWFFSGTSLRVRHLLPVYPLALVPLIVAARRFAGGGRAALPLALVVASSLGVQAVGHGLFTLSHGRRLIQGESRDAFLARNVATYTPVPWINANLSPADRVLTNDRTLLYLLDVPYYFAHDLTQTRIDMLPGRADWASAGRQLERLGVTHVLLATPDGTQAAPHLPPFEALRKAGCLIPLRRFEARRMLSRTLPTPLATADVLDLFAFRPGACRP